LAARAAVSAPALRLAAPARPAHRRSRFWPLRYPAILPPYSPPDPNRHCGLVRESCVHGCWGYHIRLRRGFPK
jgi:hypothetical protein